MPRLAKSPRVFSAHAEVVPRAGPQWQLRLRILRARGGSSTPMGTDDGGGKYSPRTRR